MSRIDPKTVREIAEDAIREGARTASIEDVLTGHPVVDHDDPESDYDAWFDAIAAQVPKATVTVSWPDEPQPAEATGGEVKCGRECSEMHTYVPGECEAAVTAEGPQEEATGGEQVQDGAASEAVIRLERWLSARQANVYEGISSTCVTAEPRDRTTAAYTIAESDLRAVLAERDALRKQLATATARAESATVLPERWRVLIAERAAAVRRAEEAEAERDLAIAHDRQPYPTAWAYEQVCRVEREQRERAEKAEARLAELEAIVAEGNQRDRALALLLLRSGGKVEFTQVEQAAAPSHGHLISYPNLATGGLVLAYSADGETVGAAPDGRSATETASEASGGAFQANTSSILFQGLSEPERSREADSVAIKLSDGEIRVPEDCPIPDDVLRAMNAMNDDTTEDDRG